MKILELLVEATSTTRKTRKKTSKREVSTKKTTLSDKDLIKISEDCRKKIIGSRPSKFGDCENVSLAIAKALISIYPDIKVADGRWDGKVSKDVSARGHVWCFIPSKKLIIDGTHDQFNSETRINVIDENNENFEKYVVIDYYNNFTRFFTDKEFEGIKPL